MRKIIRELGMEILIGFATVAFLLTSTVLTFAQEPRAEKGYTYNLKQLMEQAEKNVKKVDEDLKEKKIEKENRQRELEAREHFEKGNALYKEGKLKEAKQEWQKALGITKSAEMKGYIKQSKKRARAEECTRKKEEKERKTRLAAEQKQEKRLERERQKQLEQEKKERERKQKKEQARLKRERKKQERLKKQEELARKKEEEARLKKEKQQKQRRQRGLLKKREN